MPRKPATTFHGKPCPKCGDTLRAVKKGSPGGYCVACAKATSAAWRAAHAERKKATSAAWYAANTGRQKATSAAWRAAHPERMKALYGAWAAANSERKKAYNATWLAANRERKKAATDAWYAANTGRQKASSAAWKAANPEKVRAQNSKRRSLKQLQRCVCCEDKDFLFLFDTDWVSKDMGYEPCHVDHIVQLFMGGPDCVKNLRILIEAEHKIKNRADAKQRADFRMRARLLKAWAAPVVEEVRKPPVLRLVYSAPDLAA